MHYFMVLHSKPSYRIAEFGSGRCLRDLSEFSRVLVSHRISLGNHQPICCTTHPAFLGLQRCQQLLSFHQCYCHWPLP